MHDIVDSVDWWILRFSDALSGAKRHVVGGAHNSPWEKINKIIIYSKQNTAAIPILCISREKVSVPLVSGSYRVLIKALVIYEYIYL